MNEGATYSDPAEQLAAEFHARQAANPRYSMRAFARRLGLPPGRLSQLLSRKRLFTRDLGRKIAAALGYDAKQTRDFLHVIERSRPVRPKIMKLKLIQPPLYDSIGEDHFKVIADWYHFAMLSLVETSDFRLDFDWMGHRLGIPPAQAEEGFTRLVRLGIVRQVGGRVELVRSNNAAGSEAPSSALRESHRQTLVQTIEALDQVDLKERDVTSITMAIDVKKLPKAKQLIREFRLGLAALMESGERTEVYNLNIQLVPVTNRRIDAN